MIEVNGLSKDFVVSGKRKDNVSVKGSKQIFRAVDKLSFTVAPGEIFGLLGSNGAGKTTTLRTLATMLLPTEGSAKVCGHDIVKEPEQVRKCTGILFGGDTGLYDRLTARENIEYFARLQEMSQDRIEAVIKELVEAFDLHKYLDARVGTFSRGMKQKIAFARSIVHSPPGNAL